MITIRRTRFSSAFVAEAKDRRRDRCTTDRLSSKVVRSERKSVESLRIRFDTADETEEKHEELSPRNRNLQNPKSPID